MAEISKLPKSTSKSTREIARALYRHEITPLVFVLIVLIFAMGGITKGVTLTFANAKNVLLLTAIKGIGAVGETFVILTAGVDVSIGGNALFVSVLGAVLMTQNWQNLIGNPLPLALGALIMLLSATAWGVFNGAMVARVGIPGLISTLGLWQILTGLAFRVSSGRAIAALPDFIFWWGSGEIGGVPVPVIIFVVVLVAAYYVLNYTAYGRAVYYTGGNPLSAWLSGIDIKKILFSVYIISGFCAGLAAFLMLGRIQAATMTSMKNLELMSIAACTVGGISLTGGKGNIIGVVLGTLIMGVVNNAMSVMGANPAVIGIALGAIIILAVVIDYVRRQHS